MATRPKSKIQKCSTEPVRKIFRQFLDRIEFPPNQFYKFLPYVVIFLFAFLLRLFHILEVKQTYPFFNIFIGDAESYNNWALTIARGEWIGKKVFFQDPLYPYFLAVVYRLFGFLPELVRWIQITLGALSCVAVYETTRRLIGRRAAIIAGVICSSYGLFIFYEGTLLKEGVSIFISGAFLLVMVLTEQVPSGAIWAMSGFVLGLLILTRGNAFFMIPIIVIWLFWRFESKGLKKLFFYMSMFLMGIFTPMIPCVINNFIASGDFVLTTSQAGHAFYLGCNPRATGTYMPLVEGRQLPEHDFDDKLIAESAQGRPLKPSEVSRFWFRKSFYFIKENPGKWFKLLFTKAALFIDGFEVPDFEDYYVVKRFSRILRVPLFIYGVICPLALLGMICAFPKWKHFSLLYLIAVGNAVSVILFIVYARYRLPSVLPMIIFAAYFIDILYQWVRERKFKLVGIFLILFIVFLKVINRGTSEKLRWYEPPSLANLGMCYINMGQFDKSIQTFQEALQLLPYDYNVRFSLANAYMSMNLINEAIAECQTVLKIQPNYVEAYYLLGVLFYKQNNFKNARAYWEQALKIFPQHERAKNALQILSIKSRESLHD